MPFSEKKGRFTVSITEQPKPSVSPSPPPSASSPSNGATRAVKRGRFLVSCLPCSGPGLAATLSCEQEAGLLSSSQGVPKPAEELAGTSHSTCSSYDTHVNGLDTSTGGTEVTSPCRELSGAAIGAAPAHSPPRRVRFSETAEAAAPCFKQQEQPLHPQDMADKLQVQQSPMRQQQQQHAEPLAARLKHTRSYCRGRFTVQEAVTVPTGLHRSVSAPEWPRSSSPMSDCSSPTRAAFGSLPGDAASDNSSFSSMTSSSCFAQALYPTGSSDLLAANDLMSSLPQLPLQHDPAAATAALLMHPRTCSDGRVTGGLFPSVSVPVAFTAASSVDQHMQELQCSLLGSVDCTMSDAGGYSIATYGGSSSSAASSRNSSSSGLRGSGCSNSSSLLSSCCSGSAELLAAAAAAGYQPHHVAPRRSPSVSYFRRGRFMVQTTMV